MDGIIHTLAGSSLSSKAEYDTTVGSALKRVYRTMRTRPRRSHHRLGVCCCRKTPPTIAAALQSSPGRVWTPVLVRDHAEARLRESESYVIRLMTFGISVFLFWGFLVFLSRACVSGLSLFAGACVVRVSVCVFPCRGLCGPFCVFALLVRLRRPLGGRPVLFPVACRVGLFGVLPGSVSGFGFFRVSWHDTWGLTSPRLVRISPRKSSKLRVQQISRAKVESHSLPR